MLIGFERAQKAFVCGLLMMVVGAISIAISVFMGVSLLHLYLALTLLFVGFFLSVVGHLVMRSIRREFSGIDQKDKKEPTGQGGWVHLGNGLYCRKQDIDDRDEEIKRKAESDAYWKNNPSKKKKEK